MAALLLVNDFFVPIIAYIATFTIIGQPSSTKQLATALEIY